MSLGLQTRMDFEQLLRLQNVLDLMLFTEHLSYDEYDREWNSLLSVAGYTMRDYEAGIDRRWDYIAQDFIEKAWNRTSISLLN